ncbi:methyltransferase domain-containing protein [Sphingomonas oligoaromativorans]|uniref:methyltransferase domain-containing protein n=1 Tax=Sphingomonas oligoaromativorans TaxID=575322 RepID=UPI0014246BE7|nr:methyltransferase domain-containing protein [Sphingomonas oligoaromativorans]NIJ32200.1 2-polyprenyl-3-methyl-5-hydroxy-6-metoxy-1,4-benzoquinol methylase [Sphingomonas oligoaromativorans]
MTTLALRCRTEEQMDALDLDPETYAKVLRDLSRVNRWTFTAHPTLAYLERATKGLPRFRLLDVGFGAGDMLRAIAVWAKKRGIAADLVGVDLNPRSEGIARAATPADLAIDYRTGDYHDVEGPIDFIVSSQVTHHMTDAQLHAFIRHMEARSARGWLISDLHRHRFAHGSYPLLARLMRVHRIVREDGTLSIARSFRPDEWRPILEEAGVSPSRVTIARRFPFRLTVERLR